MNHKVCFISADKTKSDFLDSHDQKDGKAFPRVKTAKNNNLTRVKSLEQGQCVEVKIVLILSMQRISSRLLL